MSIIKKAFNNFHLLDFAQEKVRFRCNICGNRTQCSKQLIGREIPSCASCGSTVRMRAMVHCLSTSLFGKSLVISEFQEKADIVGFGMSDWDGYADRIAKKLAYKNTFYHQEPKIDILNPPEAMVETCDFIISSDVFEHIIPPVSAAFRNTLKLLKPRGVVIFSVPYKLTGETIEHFPGLHNSSLEEDEDGYVLKNVEIDGSKKQYRDLVFHGGEGSTLEMRLFSLGSLRKEFESAGFHDFRVWDQSYPEFGIYVKEKWSLPITARK